MSGGLAEWRRERRVRRMLRRMDRLDRRAASRRDRGGWRDRPRLRAGLAVGLFLALMGGFMARIVLDPESTGTVYAWPTDEGERLDRPPPREVPGGGRYAFMQVQDGSEEPVTYDPCRTIRVVVNERLAPPDADEILDAAIGEVEDATGLELVVEGATSEPPMQEGEIRDGDRWRPVQVSWSDPDEVSDLAGSVAGLGGSTWVERDDHRWYVTGEVVLDGPQLRELGSEASVGVLMHELAHVLGLDHVDDRGELLHPSSPRTAWGSGDLAGLAALGQGRCG